MNNQNQQERYDKAKKRVEDEKGFYSHLTTYIIINIVILIVNRYIYTNADSINTDVGFTKWLNWHIFITPALWGIGLVCHGIWVFKKNSLLNKGYKKSIFSKEWEERKIKELMDKDDF
ncbi:2TM domain-containing protein [Aquimarina sediminis]|uniref:2TM domain-containing protein n=1 Tax=Aquimarina sediminis TaxID=2070536 RepID=UPI000CA08AEF|nr:2TM domain-containing protein [Aquimarina sediminis]